LAFARGGGGFHTFTLNILILDISGRWTEKQICGKQKATTRNFLLHVSEDTLPLGAREVLLTDWLTDANDGVHRPTRTH
jgi:hypothetical protein